MLLLKINPKDNHFTKCNLKWFKVKTKYFYWLIKLSVKHDFLFNRFNGFLFVENWKKNIDIGCSLSCGSNILRGQLSCADLRLCRLKEVLPGDHRLQISTAVDSIRVTALHSTEQNSVTVDTGRRSTDIKLSSKEPNPSSADVNRVVIQSVQNCIMIDIDRSSVDPMLSKTDFNHMTLSCTQTDINFSSVFRRAKIHCDRYWPRFN